MDVKKAIKTRYNVVKMFYLLHRLRRWVMTTKSPVKRNICATMFDVTLPLYEKKKPKWLPKIKPIPEGFMATKSVANVLKDISADVEKEKAANFNA
jgi:hypothetical protein